MNAYEELTQTSDAELVRMDRQFARYTAWLLSLAFARSPFRRHIIADVGTGLGAVAAHLVDYRESLDLIAIDSINDRVAVVHDRMKQHRLRGRVVVDDAETLSTLPDDSVTILLLSFCLTHVNSVAAVMAAVARVLRAGGMVVVSDVDYCNAAAANDTALTHLLARIRAHLAHADLCRLDQIARASGLSPVSEEHIDHVQTFNGAEIRTLALDFVKNFKDDAARSWLAAVSPRACLRWRRVQRLYRKPLPELGWTACTEGTRHA